MPSPARPTRSRVTLSPLFACGMFLVAFLTARVICEHVPAARRRIGSDAARMHPLDGLRAWLATAVMVHHAAILWQYLHSHIWALPPSRLFTQFGQGGVALFFMVTAFLFWGRVLDTRGRIDWLDFAIARVWRLYPAYLTMLTGVLIAVAALSGFQLREPLGTVLADIWSWLLFTLPAASNINGVPETGRLVAYVPWSLPYEAAFYVLLPVTAALAFRVFRPTALFGSGALLLLIVAQAGWVWPFYTNIALAFLGGVVAAHARRWSPLCQWTQSSGAGVLALASLAVALTQFTTAYTWGATLCYAGFFGIVACGNTLWGVLEWRSALWLGQVSYSVYLLHGLVLYTVADRLGGWFDVDRTSEWLFVVLSLSSAAVVVAMASLVALTIEIPGIAMGRAMIARRRCRAAKMS